jgi:hypothetical protein
MALACTAMPATLAPTPNIDATVEAKLAQERAVEATVEARLKEEKASQPTPKPDATNIPTPTLTPKPKPTATRVRPTRPPVPTRWPTWTPAPATTPTATPAPTSADELDYFYEIAFGAEFGSSTDVLHKWKNDIRIKVFGTPTDVDLSTLNQVVDELNDLMTSLSVEIVDGNFFEIEMHFAPEATFKTLDPNYAPTNMGFFWTWWWDNAITDARILISSVGITQKERSHLIREELTQSLGLMNDSYRYENSIFQQAWTNTIEYDPVDEAVIKLLYDPRIHSGMTRNSVERVLGIR